MGLRGTYLTDDKVEKQGLLVQLSPTTRWRVARAGGGNTEYKRVLLKLSEPHAAEAATGMLDEQTDREIMYETYARAIVKDCEELIDGEWHRGIKREDVDMSVPEGTTTAKEQLLPYTHENVVAVFRNMHDLYLRVQRVSNTQAEYRQAANEAIVGN